MNVCNWIYHKLVMQSFRFDVTKFTNDHLQGRKDELCSISPSTIIVQSSKNCTSIEFNFLWFLSWFFSLKSFFFSYFFFPLNPIDFFSLHFAAFDAYYKFPEACECMCVWFFLVMMRKKNPRFRCRKNNINNSSHVLVPGWFCSQD